MQKKFLIDTSLGFILFLMLLVCVSSCSSSDEESNTGKWTKNADKNIIGKWARNDNGVTTSFRFQPDGKGVYENSNDIGGFFEYYVFYYDDGKRGDLSITIKYYNLRGTVWEDVLSGAFNITEGKMRIGDYVYTKQ